MIIHASFSSDSQCSNPWTSKPNFDMPNCNFWKDPGSKNKLGKKNCDALQVAQPLSKTSRFCVTETAAWVNLKLSERQTANATTPDFLTMQNVLYTAICFQQFNCLHVTFCLQNGLTELSKWKTGPSKCCRINRWHPTVTFWIEHLPSFIHKLRHFLRIHTLGGSQTYRS